MTTTTTSTDAISIKGNEDVPPSLTAEEFSKHFQEVTGGEPSTLSLVPVVIIFSFTMDGDDDEGFKVDNLYERIMHQIEQCKAENEAMTSHDTATTVVPGSASVGERSLAWVYTGKDTDTKKESKKR